MWTNICLTSICRLIFPAWDQELLITTLRFINSQRVPICQMIISRGRWSHSRDTFSGDLRRIDVENDAASRGGVTPSSSYPRSSWPGSIEQGEGRKGGENRLLAPRKLLRWKRRVLEAVVWNLIASSVAVDADNQEWVGRGFHPLSPVLLYVAIVYRDRE